MPADDLRKRIEALNKGPMKNVPEASEGVPSDIKALRRKLERQKGKGRAPATSHSPTRPPRAVSAASSPEVPQPIIYCRTAPVAQAAAGYGQTPAGRDFGPPVNLEEAVAGIVAESPDGPGYYLVEQPAVALEADSVFLHRRFVSLTGYPDGYAVKPMAAVCGIERIAPRDIVFLDLETTGLGTTPLFLVGTMECADDGFRFRQYFARDYSEEVSILSAVSERLREARLMVTFNGKTFDVPFMRNRSVATGVKLNLPESHLDLLHEARRVYRRDLPNCRLQTLEQMVCGRRRDDDIPGSEIPSVYHEYVRTGNANKISVVLMHNLYDLLTMADLMSRMWGRE